MTLKEAEESLATIAKLRASDKQSEAANLKVRLLASYVLAIAESRITPRDVLLIARAIRESWLRSGEASEVR